MLHTLRKPANEGRVWIVDGGLLEFKLLKNRQITIHSILSTKRGVGSQLLNRLLDYAREHEATSLFAKCPTDLESNEWYKKKGFSLEKVENTGAESGRKLNWWRLPLVEAETIVEGPRDGFLYHHGGTSPMDQLKRLIADEPNLEFDDLFAATVDEADEAIREAEKEQKKLLERLKEVRSTLELKIAHRTKITEAIQQYRETGEIGEVLIPACRKLASEQSREQAEADADAKVAELKSAKQDLKEQIGDGWYDPQDGGWIEHDSRVDDHYVYVTIKRARKVHAPHRPDSDQIAAQVRKRVRQAFEAYRVAFRTRVNVPDVTTAPASPQAP